MRAWGQSIATARRFAALAHFPYRSIEWPYGTAANWQNHRFPGTASFVVELPPGPVPAATDRRLGARACASSRSRECAVTRRGKRLPSAGPRWIGASAALVRDAQRGSAGALEQLFRAALAARVSRRTARGRRRCRSRGHRAGVVSRRGARAGPLRPAAPVRPVAAPDRRQPGDRLGACAHAAARARRRRGRRPCDAAA